MKRAALISVIVGAALAIVPAAFAVEMSDGGGAVSSGVLQLTPMSQIDPAIQAVLVRNRAAQSPALTGKALADFYDTGAVVTSEAVAPLTGKVLADFRDIGAFVGQPDILSGTHTTQTTTRSVDPATQAVLLRSRGLADYYSANAVTLTTDTLGGKAAPATLPVSSGNSFDWSNALAVTLGAMLILAIAATTVTRRRHRLSY